MAQRLTEQTLHADKYRKAASTKRIGRVEIWSGAKWTCKIVHRCDAVGEKRSEKNFTQGIPQGKDESP